MNHWMYFYLAHHIKTYFLLQNVAAHYTLLRSYDPKIAVSSSDRAFLFSVGSYLLAAVHDRTRGHVSVGAPASFEHDGPWIHTSCGLSEESLMAQSLYKYVGVVQDAPENYDIQYVGGSSLVITVHGAETQLTTAWLAALDSKHISIISKARVLCIGSGDALGSVSFEVRALSFKGVHHYDALKLSVEGFSLYGFLSVGDAHFIAEEGDICGHLHMRSGYHIEVKHCSLRSGVWEERSTECPRWGKIGTWVVDETSWVSSHGASWLLGDVLLSGAMAWMHATHKITRLEGSGSVYAHESLIKVDRYALRCWEQRGGQLSVTCAQLKEGAYLWEMLDSALEIEKLSCVGLGHLTMHTEVCSISECLLSGAWSWSGSGVHMQKMRLVEETSVRLLSATWMMDHVALEDQAQLEVHDSEMYADSIWGTEHATLYAQDSPIYADQIHLGTLKLHGGVSAGLRIALAHALESATDSHVLQSSSVPLESWPMGYAYIIDVMPESVADASTAHGVIKHWLGACAFEAEYHVMQKKHVPEGLIDSLCSEGPYALLEIQGQEAWEAVYIRTPQGCFALSDEDAYWGMPTAGYREHVYGRWVWIFYVFSMHRCPNSPEEAWSGLWQDADPKIRPYLSVVFQVPVSYCTRTEQGSALWLSSDLDVDRYCAASDVSKCVIGKQDLLTDQFFLEVCMLHASVLCEKGMKRYAVSGQCSKVEVNHMEMYAASLCAQHVSFNTYLSDSASLYAAQSITVKRMECRYSFCDAGRGHYRLGPETQMSYFFKSIFRADSAEYSAPTAWEVSHVHTHYARYRKDSVVSQSELTQASVHVMPRAHFTHRNSSSRGASWVLLGETSASCARWDVSGMLLKKASLKSSLLNCAHLDLRDIQLWEGVDVQADAVCVSGSVRSSGVGHRFWGVMRIGYDAAFSQRPEDRNSRDYCTSLHILGSADIMGEWQASDSIHVAGRLHSEDLTLLGVRIRFSRLSELTGASCTLMGETVHQEASVSLNGDYLIRGQWVESTGNVRADTCTLQAGHSLVISGRIETKRFIAQSGYSLHWDGSLRSEDCSAQSLVMYQNTVIHTQRSSVCAGIAFGWSMQYMDGIPRIFSKSVFGHLLIQTGFYGVCAYFGCPMVLCSVAEESWYALDTLRSCVRSGTYQNLFYVSLELFSFKTLSLLYAQYHAMIPRWDIHSYVSWLIRYWWRQDVVSSRAVVCDGTFLIQCVPSYRHQGLFSLHAGFSLVGVEQQSSVLGISSAWSMALYASQQNYVRIESGIVFNLASCSLSDQSYLYGRRQSLWSDSYSRVCVLYGTQLQYAGRLCVDEYHIAREAQCSMRSIGFGVYAPRATQMVVRSLSVAGKFECSDASVQGEHLCVEADGSVDCVRGQWQSRTIKILGCMDPVGSDLELGQAGLGVINITSSEVCVEVLRIEGRCVLDNSRVSVLAYHSGAQSCVVIENSACFWLSADCRGRVQILGESKIFSSYANYHAQGVFEGAGTLYMIYEQGTLASKISVQHLVISPPKGTGVFDLIAGCGAYANCRPEFITCCVEGVCVVDQSIHRDFGEGWSLLAEHLSIRGIELSGGSIYLSAKNIEISNTKVRAHMCVWVSEHYRADSLDMNVEQCVQITSSADVALCRVLIEAPQVLVHAEGDVGISQSLIHAQHTQIISGAGVRMSSCMMYAEQSLEVEAQLDIELSSEAGGESLYGSSLFVMRSERSIYIYETSVHAGCYAVYAQDELLLSSASPQGAYAHEYGLYAHDPEGHSILEAQGKMNLYAVEILSAGSLTVRADELRTHELMRQTEHQGTRLRKAVSVDWLDLSERSAVYGLLRSVQEAAQSIGGHTFLNALNAVMKSGKMLFRLRYAHPMDQLRWAHEVMFGQLSPAAHGTLYYERVRKNASVPVMCFLEADRLYIHTGHTLWKGRMSARSAYIVSEHFELQSSQAVHTQVTRRYRCSFRVSLRGISVTCALEQRVEHTTEDLSSVCHFGYVHFQVERLSLRGSQCSADLAEGHIGSVYAEDGRLRMDSVSKKYSLGLTGVGVESVSEHQSEPVRCALEFRDHRTDIGEQGAFSLETAGTAPHVHYIRADASASRSALRVSYGPRTLSYSSNIQGYEMRHQERIEFQKGVSFEFDADELAHCQRLFEGSGAMRLDQIFARLWGIGSDDAVLYLKRAFILAESAYSSEPLGAEILKELGMRYRECIYISETGLHVYVYEDLSGACWLSFSGTPTDWGADMYHALISDDFFLMLQLGTGSVSCLLEHPKMTEYLAKERLYLVGHSRGAAVALELAERHPQHAVLAFDSPKTASTSLAVCIQSGSNAVNRLAQGGFRMSVPDSGSDLLLRHAPNQALGLFYVKEELHKHKISTMRGAYERGETKVYPII